MDRRYEHCVTTHTDDLTSEDLHRIARRQDADGWELAGIYGTQYVVRMLWKRPVADPPTKDGGDMIALNRRNT